MKDPLEVFMEKVMVYAKNIPHIPTMKEFEDALFVTLSLTDREKIVLRQRVEGKTLKQIGEIMPCKDWQKIGVTREYVRQKESKAIRKIRAPILTSPGLRMLGLSENQIQKYKQDFDNYFGKVRGEL